MWQPVAEMSQDVHAVTVGKHGRVVIPVSLRNELGLDVGTELVARVDCGRLVLEPRDLVVERVRGRFRHLAGGVVDEFLAERKLEAQRESGE